MKKIQMVDLATQYQKIKKEIDEAVISVMESTQFIGGERIKSFKEHLENYLQVKHVIPCANGTDALQIAFMALELEPGDEVIVPAFTYVATAEVIALLRLKPVMVDVQMDDFNMSTHQIKNAITSKTKAIVPVHLFGQVADMETIMDIAVQHQLYVVEDNAQAIGADYFYMDGRKQKAGTIGHIGCTSFFPSKNLGCYGDGGAIFTQDDEISQKITMIANHGQSKQYYHDVVGVNSRLDAMQAAILDIKLRHLDEYATARRQAADYYDQNLSAHPNIVIPYRNKHSTHVFHQYTLRITNGKRDALKEYLTIKGIPCGIYYPLPLYEQKAFIPFLDKSVNNLPVTEQLCKEVISLPMHTELNPELQNYIVQEILHFMS
ncbi:MAG: DegT/DnrJ/EryC1/StrS family aminotransferase [Saprospiraceae bacterium]|nr:DegT/DnrJ/EryC1/StrS family aminotransferase [Saprospiraceae bacterium]